MPHHFISYSTVEAADEATSLHDTLEAGQPSYPVWLDKRDLQPGRPWDSQIADAIRECRTLLFMMTPDSVDDTSVCYEEWTLALRYKKTVVPLRLDREAEPPFRLHQRRFIDFLPGFEEGVRRLRDYLAWLDSPAGQLQTMQDRLRDAQRDLRRARDEIEQGRIQAEIEQLREDIRQQQAVVEDPQAALQASEENIQRAIEEERQAPAVSERERIINVAPGEVPDYFQDREEATASVGEFLQHPTQRLLTIIGRGGVGKTALVVRVLKALEEGQLPDEAGPLAIDGIVYFSSKGTQRINLPNFFSDVSRLLPGEVAEELEEVYRNPTASVEEQMRALLAHFSEGRYVVLLDNFEDLTDAATQSITDEEMAEALRAFLEAPAHNLKIILTSRFTPRNLLLTRPELQRRVDLNTGLASPYAENLLRDMDAGGLLGLRDLPEDAPILQEARRRTHGFPRALEALFGILSADRSTTLEEVLDEMEQRGAGPEPILAQNVIEVLVGEAFSRLDERARRVMQALAIYGRPVPPVAVDYLLQPYIPGIQSEPVLRRLVNMHLAQKEGKRYFLQEADADYALSLIPATIEDAFRYGGRADETQEQALFHRQALYQRGADYFRQARRPQDEWRNLDDLMPQLAEIDLRIVAGDYDTAAQVLTGIDFDYLRLWGHYRLRVRLYEQLQGNIDDPARNARNVSNLGIAYSDIGELQTAVEYLQQGLAAAREIRDRELEGSNLGRLGNAFADLGQLQAALENYEQALEIAREVGDTRRVGVWQGNIGIVYGELGQLNPAVEAYTEALNVARRLNDRRSESIWLFNLGNAHADLGNLTLAIDYYQQSLVIDREIGFKQKEAADLGSLGNAYADLGQTAEALNHHEQARAIFSEMGDRVNEATALLNIGDAYLDQDDLVKAQTFYRQARDMADEVGFAKIQANARRGLALVLLLSDDLAGARQAIEGALPQAVPDDRDNLYSVAGLVALRQGDITAAQRHFMATVTQTNRLLGFAERNYSALDIRALVLCGLAICTNSPQRLATAVENFRRARAITTAPGVVKRVLRLYDEMKEADRENVLYEAVRAAATGETQ